MADLVLKDRAGTQITYNGVEVVSIPNAEGGTSHFLNLETGGIPSGGTAGQVLKKLSETDHDVGWGDTPIKGIDYWTEADKGEIIQAVVDVMGGSLIGYVDENNVIVLVGGLEGETYTVKYKMEDDSLIEIGELVLSEPEEPEEVINQIPISTDASGEPFNGGQGWKTGYRMSISSGSETAAEGYECTGFIPVAYGDVIRIKGVDIREENSTNMVAYDSDKLALKTGGGTNIGTTLYHLFITNGTEETGGVYKCTLNSSTFPNLHSGLAYIRFGSREITDESIFTVNQEIVFEEPEEPEEVINQIPISTDASGNPFVGTNGEQGYKTGYRLSLSSGGETAASGYECTGFIPATATSTIRIKNVNMTEQNATNLICYDSNKTPVAVNGSNFGAKLYFLFVTHGTVSNGVYTSKLSDSGLSNLENVAYIRIGSQEITSASILTINQEIV